MGESIPIDDLIHVLGGGSSEKPKTRTWLTGILGNQTINLSNIINVIHAYSDDDGKSKLERVDIVKVISSIMKICHSIKPPKAIAGKVSGSTLMSASDVSPKTIDTACGQIIKYLTKMADVITAQDESFVKSLLKSIGGILEEIGIIAVTDVMNVKEMLGSIVTGVGLLCQNMFISALSNIQAAGRIINSAAIVIKYLKAYLDMPRVKDRIPEADQMVILHVIDFISMLNNTERDLLIKSREGVADVINDITIQGAIENVIGMSTPEDDERARTALQMIIAMTAVDSIIEKVLPLDRSMAEKISKFRKENPHAIDRLAVIVDDVVEVLGPRMEDKLKRELKILVSVLMGTPLFNVNDIAGTCDGGNIDIRGHINGGSVIEVLDDKIINMMRSNRHRPRLVRKSNTMRAQESNYIAIMNNVLMLSKHINENPVLLSDEIIASTISDISNLFRTFKNKSVLLTIVEVSNRKQGSNVDNRAILSYLRDLSVLKQYMTMLEGKGDAVFKSIVKSISDSIINTAKSIKIILDKIGDSSERLREYAHLILDKGAKETKLIRAEVTGGVVRPIGDAPIYVDSDIIDSMPHAKTELEGETRVLVKDDVRGGSLHGNMNRVNKSKRMDVGDVILMIDSVAKLDKKVPALKKKGQKNGVKSAVKAKAKVVKSKNVKGGGGLTSFISDVRSKSIDAAKGLAGDVLQSAMDEIIGGVHTIDIAEEETEDDRRFREIQKVVMVVMVMVR